MISEIKFKITFKNQVATIAQRYKENFKNQFFNNTSSRNKSGKNKNNSKFNFCLESVDSRDKKEKKRRENRAAQQNLVCYNYNKSEYKKSDYPDLKNSSNSLKN
jgi:hypothetical protein